MSAALMKLRFATKLLVLAGQAGRTRKHAFANDNNKKQDEQHGGERDESTDITTTEMSRSEVTTYELNMSSFNNIDTTVNNTAVSHLEETEEAISSSLYPTVTKDGPLMRTSIASTSTELIDTTIQSQPQRLSSRKERSMSFLLNEYERISGFFDRSSILSFDMDEDDRDEAGNDSSISSINDNVVNEKEELEFSCSPLERFDPISHEADDVRNKNNLNYQATTENESQNDLLVLQRPNTIVDQQKKWLDVVLDIRTAVRTEIIWNNDIQKLSHTMTIDSTNESCASATNEISRNLSFIEEQKCQPNTHHYNNKANEQNNPKHKLLHDNSDNNNNNKLNEQIHHQQIWLDEIDMIRRRSIVTLSSTCM